MEYSVCKLFSNGSKKLQNMQTHRHTHTHTHTDTREEREGERVGNCGKTDVAKCKNW